MRRTCLAALFVLAACGTPPPPPPPAPISVEKTAPDVSLMAGDFLRDFDEHKFAGKVIEVTGIFSDWTLVGEPRRPTDITLLAPGWPDKIFFALDREVMDNRLLILDYWSLIRLKGRYERRDADGTVRLRDAVVTTTHVVAEDYPTGVAVAATELTEAFWPPDTTVAESRKFAGRVVEVSGSVASVDGIDIVLRSVDDTRPVRCRLQEKDPSIVVGQAVVLKGFCMGHVSGTTGVTVIRCVKR